MNKYKSLFNSVPTRDIELVDLNHLVVSMTIIYILIYLMQFVSIE